MSQRRKYHQDDDLQLRLLEVTEDTAYNLKKRQTPPRVIAEVPKVEAALGVAVVNKTLH